MKTEDQPKSKTVPCHNCKLPRKYKLAVSNPFGDINYFSVYCPKCGSGHDIFSVYTHWPNGSPSENIKKKALAEKAKSS